MKIKKGFELREVASERIIVATGVENIDFSKIISMNESAALLWNSVVGKEFELSTLAAILVEEYGIEQELADRDCEKIVSEWLKVGIIIK